MKFNIPEKDKNEKWHKDVALELRNSTLMGSLQHKKICLGYEYYNSIQNQEAFNFMQRTEDGSTLPAKFIDYNQIKVKVDSLVGECERKGYQVSTNVVNSDASNRRLEKRREKLVLMDLRSMFDEMAEVTGGEVSPINPEQAEDRTAAGYIPRSKQDLEDWESRDYRDIAGIVMDRLIKYTIKFGDWDNVRTHAFRDIPIAGACIFKTEMVNGFPTAPRRVDPRNFIFDRNCEDDYLRNASFVGEFRYLPLSKAIVQYRLTDEQIERFSNMNYLSLSGTVYPYLKEFNGINHVLLFYVEFKDTKAYKKEVTKDFDVNNLSVGDKKFGVQSAVTSIVDISISPEGDGFDVPSAAGVSNVKSAVLQKSIEIVRYCTLLGQDLVVDFGELKNQVRSVDDPANTDFSYTAFFPNMYDGYNLSMCGMAMPLQDLMNICMFNVQLSLAKSLGDGFVYDLSSIPKGWDAKNVISYFKKYGIAFIDTHRMDGQATPFNQFGKVSINNVESIRQNLEIANFCATQMQVITGINEARQGNSPDNAPVGTTQIQLSQSTFQTQYMFSGFDRLTERIFNKVCGLYKLSALDPKNKERLVNIAGENGYMFLQNDFSLTLNDYQVAIDTKPYVFQDKEKLSAELGMAMQQGALGQGLEAIEAYIQIMSERDIQLGLRLMQQKINERAEKQKMEELQQMAMQNEQAMAMQQQQQSGAMEQQGMQEDTKKLAISKDAMANQTKANTDVAKTQMKIEAEQMNRDIAPEDLPPQFEQPMGF